MRAKGALLLMCFAFLISPIQSIGQDDSPANQIRPTSTPTTVQIEGESGSTTIVIPENSPWWFGAVVIVLSSAAYVIKKYVDYKLTASEKAQLAAHDAQTAEQATIERDQTIDLTQVQMMLKLIEGIGKSVDAQVESNARQEASEKRWIEDRKQASEERRSYIHIMEAQGESIKANTQGVSDLVLRISESDNVNKEEHRITRAKVEEINGKVDQVIELLKPRVSSGSNDQTHTKDVTLEVASAILEEVKDKVSQLPEGE